MSPLSRASVENLKQSYPFIKERPVVCIQGLGFVGAAMSVAVANTIDERGEPHFNVIGLDLPNEAGLARIEALNAGNFPFKISDSKLVEAVKNAAERGNFFTTSDPEVYSLASVTVVDVHLDIDFSKPEPEMRLGSFKKAIQTLGERMLPGSLVLVETTVPPGTCEKVVVPELAVALERRGLPADSILVAHSYERVMPGKDYYDSIVNFWRVFAGHTPEAADACEDFLSKVINFKDFLPTRLKSTTASETSKVLENSYRAVNIAFIDEWGRFAEAVGVDIFEVINAIRFRPTHNNIRQPGFGVGGYCLTKDPLFAPLAAKDFFGLDMDFPFSRMSVKTNNDMPKVTVDKVQELLGGSLEGKKILLCGVSYRQDVGDTRYSPSQIFVEVARSRGAIVLCHDPLVDYWEELDDPVLNEIPAPLHVDAVVLAVPHNEYRLVDFAELAKGALIFDANNVLSETQIARLDEAGANLATIGRG